MDTDSALLRRYSDQGDDDAFAEVARRQTNLVYSVALRVTNNPLLAEDVTQAVFIKLVRQARLLGRYPTIIGWLHTTTRNTAIDTLRSESRRRAREHEAMTMYIDSIRDETNWAQLRPMLDEAVSRLNPRDREAVLLRFFNGLTHQEVGATLGLTENSANKRIERALEKLRVYLTRRGVVATSATLAAAISTNSVEAAPAGLAAHVTKGALSATAVAGTLGAALSLVFFFMSTKTKALLAVVILAAMVTAVAFKLSKSDASTSKPVTSVIPIQTAPQSKPNETTTMVAPVATGAAKVATSTPEINSAEAITRKELNTTMDEIIAMLQSGDAATAAENFVSPKSFEAMGPGMKEQLRTQMMQVIASPNGQKSIQVMIQVLGEMKTQAPTMNATGDRATFVMSDPTLGPPDITFRKLDGKWYVIMPHSPE